MEHTNLELYIQIKNGQPFEHPIFANNFRQAFPDIDLDNLPTDKFAKFIRVAKPTLGAYEMYVGVTYQWVDGVVKDVHEVRAMTDEEKATKQQAVKDAWTARPQAENWAVWTFDETTCTYVPPIPRPAPDPVKLQQGISTFWCGADNNWKDTPVRPTGTGPYNFDFLAWQWVEVTSDK